MDLLILLEGLKSDFWVQVLELEVEALDAQDEGECAFLRRFSWVSRPGEEKGEEVCDEACEELVCETPSIAIVSPLISQAFLRASS